MSRYNNPSFDIARKPDSLIWSQVADVIKEVKWSLTRVDYTPDWEAQPVTLQGTQLDPQLESLLSKDLVLLRRIAWTLENGVVVHLKRDTGKPFDQVSITLGKFDQHPAQFPADFGDFLSQLKSTLGELTEQSYLAHFGEGIQRHYEVREQTLGRLETTVANVVEQFTSGAAEHANKLREELRTDREQLHSEFEAKRQDEAERLKERDTELREREAELTSKLTDLDDRAARHARRETYKALKEQFANFSQRFEVTKGTKVLRQPVAWMFLLLALFFLGTFSWLFVNDHSSMGLVRQATLGIGFVTTAWAYIRWQNKWFEQHAREEFRLKRMALDIDRASWVVEMSMEWKDEKGTELPPDLLHRLTAHLFEQETAKEPDLHPADQLASALLGSSARVKLSLPGGGEAELDRKGIEQLKKASK